MREPLCFDKSATSVYSFTVISVSVVYDILESRNPWWQDPKARRAGPFSVRRKLQETVLQRLQNLRDHRATMVLGPRQVGKTVLLRQVADDLLDGGWPAGSVVYFDFSDDRLTERVSPREVVEAIPRRLDSQLPTVLLFDEISSALRWDLWLKQAVDESRFEEGGGLRIAVTDSAAGLLRRGSRESGLGRWDELRMEPADFGEFLTLATSQIDAGPALPQLVERYLTIGGFPEHIRADATPQVSFKSLDRLREDIVARAILRDLGESGADLLQLRALFVHLVQMSGAELNFSRLAKRLDASRTSVRRWMALLEDTMLLSTLPLFARSAGKRARARPKVHACDPGVISAFSVRADDDRALRGRRVEAAVYRHLRSFERVEISYARDRQQREIDFVIEVEGRRIAVEVTSSQTVTKDKRQKLIRAAEAFDIPERCLIHGGFESETVDNVRLIPLTPFLRDPETLLEPVS